MEDGSAAEFNFHFDPEAAYMVLHELSCPITTFSWEAVLQNQYPWVCKIKKIRPNVIDSRYCGIMIKVSPYEFGSFCNSMRLGCY